MKKLALAMAVLAGLSLSACSSNNQQQNGNAYKGQVLFSQYQGENLNKWLFLTTQLWWLVLV